MGQKVNAKGFRLAKKQSWNNSSFVSLFNYNLVTNQDLNIRKFIKGFLFYLEVFHSFIQVSRTKGIINILITVYNKDFWFKRHGFLFRYKKRLKKKSNSNKNTGGGPKHFRKKNFFFHSIFCSFKLYKSLHNSRLPKKIRVFRKANHKKSSGLDIFNKKGSLISLMLKAVCFKYSFYKTLSKKTTRGLNSKLFYFAKNTQKFGICYGSIKKIKPLNSLYSYSFLTYSLIKFKCFVIYSKLVYSYFFSKMFSFSKIKLAFYLSKTLRFSPNISCGVSKHDSLKLAVFNQSNRLNYKWEGLSLKSLICLYVKKLTGILNVNVTFLYLNSPRRLYKFFNKLKLNVRARGNLRKEVFNLYLILYQSFKFKSPNFFSLYFIILLKKNIKKVGQLFAILKFSLPSFCLLFGFKGVRFQLKGRINGARRSRVIQVQSGSIPLTTFSNNVYYSFNKVMTIHGIYGLKIWYYV